MLGEGGEGSADLANYDKEAPVLHVLVVGFHHKKGCQVEFSHPPLVPGGDAISPQVPSQWRNLPSLALPDGSHNWSDDTVYFHLPALHDPRKTVFGISCYRQIDAEKVRNKTEDITRGTVQKSVCVLSRLPLYGQIQVKMSLITQAYFEEGDFSNVSLIKETYENLNSCLSDDMLHTQQLYVGLSARDFVIHYRQRALQLFKLVLLERKVLFFKSPVRELSSHILTLLSLLPGMLEGGLDEAACLVPDDTPEASPLRSPNSPLPPAEENSPTSSVHSYLPTSESVNSLSSKVKDKVSGALGYISGSSARPSVEDLPQQITDEEQMEAAPPPELPDFAKVCSLGLGELGLPLRLYTAGNLCHPYLSLPYVDILTQPCIRGYVIGATNALFKAKRELSHVIIDIDEEKMEVADPELRRALSLTTEDLRFTDNLARVVGEWTGTWEGGDEWVRAQFRFYLACLLRTSLEPQESNAMHLFNSHFTEQLRETRWHSAFARVPPPSLANLVVGHPCSGAVSVADVKLRLTHTMTNTDGGKKVTAAMASTGRAVGGAVSQAKGVFSSWWGGKKAGKEVSPGEEVKESEIKPEEAAKVPEEKCEAKEKSENVETSKVSEGDVKEEKLKEVDLSESEGKTEIGGVIEN